jgi:hypothetical protein
MIISIEARAGDWVSLDLSPELGERLEIECLQFLIPPIEFRLVRNSLPLQAWQAGNRELYDLQHGPGTKEWCRDGHWFMNDLDHRQDVATCGVLCRDLGIETRGLGFPISLFVWPRQSTLCR